MDRARTEVFRRRLLAERQALLDLRGIGGEAGGIVGLDQTSVGRLSRMDAMQGQAIARERSRRRERELQRIDAALRRLDGGDYWVCAACGEFIGERRLALDPAAALCIECAGRAER
ncbi:MAG: TraR/DksA family transcriptional regulator [Gammaproteobacteria bacterium]|jgi:DnaK suppressor protein